MATEKFAQKIKTLKDSGEIMAKNTEKALAALLTSSSVAVRESFRRSARWQFVCLIAVCGKNCEITAK